MSIATKTGDAGETSLMYGRRVSKTDARMAANGGIDELNAALGVARVTSEEAFVTEQIYVIQKELIVVMGELATAEEDLARYAKDGFELTTATMVDRLTAVIDNLEKDKLLHFTDWVIPGRTMLSATLDVARTTCRRAERTVAALPLRNPEIVRYLNRLSDLCWLLGRYAEKKLAVDAPSR
ncbi:MAG: cob(I)yrinic acid a,c-diamide adenosyltransferase [Chthoniobacterales bacterium]